MKVLQVKKYHRLIADKKYENAILRWKNASHPYSYPVKSMFYFFSNIDFLIERKNGYVVYDDNSAKYLLHKAEIKQIR